MKTAPARSFRLAGVSGIVSMIFSIGGFGLIGAAGFAVQAGTDSEVRDIVSRVAPFQVQAGVSLDMLGSVAFVLFIAGLWARLRSHEPPPAWLSTAALGAGLLAVAASFIDKTLFYALYSLSGRDLDPQTARVLFFTARGSFVLFTLFAGAMAGITGLSILRFRSFQRWLGWLGLIASVAGVVSAAAPDSGLGQAGFIFVAPWLLAMSIALILKAPERYSPQQPFK